MSTDLASRAPADLLAARAASRARTDELADQIAVCAARIDAATHQLLVLIRAFDREKGWARQGSKSCATWLSWRIGLGPEAAREKVRVALALETLPRIDACFERGELSYTKVRAMTRVATPKNEDLLLAQARGTTGAELERICSGFRRVVRGRATDEERRYVRRRTLQDGSVQIELRLLPDEAELVWKAIAAARDALRGEDEPAESPPIGERPAEARPAPDVSAETPCAAETARSIARASEGGAPRATLADGAVAMAEAWLAMGGRLSGRPGAERQVLFVHLSERDLSAAREDRGVAWGTEAECTSAAETSVSAAPGNVADADASDSATRPWKAELFDGVALSGESLLRVACDCGLIAAKTDARGGVLDLGRRRRTVSTPLRRALVLRDRGCRFPGCRHRAFVQAHHIEHWAHGGPTALDNTVLLCHRHHVLLHEGGFGVRRDGDKLRFVDPDGRTLEPHPKPPLTPAPLRALERDQQARGLAIDARTALPRRPAQVEVVGCVRALVGVYEREGA